MAKSTALYVTFIMWGSLILILYKAQMPHKYNINDCFQWRYNKKNIGRVDEIRKFRYKYSVISPEFSGGKFMKIGYLDGNTQKTECE